MAIPRKSFTKLAPSTAAKYRNKHFHYCFLYDEQVERFERRGVEPEVIRTWMRIRRIMNCSPRRGYLLDEFGNLITIQELSDRFRKRPTTMEREVEKLLELSLFEYREDTLSCPWLIQDAAISEENSGENGDNSSKNGNSSIRNPDSSTSPDSTRIPSSKGSSQIRENQNTGFNYPVVEYSREEKRRVNDSSLLSSTVQTTGETNSESLQVRELSATGQTTNSPHVAALPSVAAPSADWITAELRAEFQHLDLDAAVSKWLTLSETKGWPKSMDKLRKFLARERPQRGAGQGYAHAHR